MRRAQVLTLVVAACACGSDPPGDDTATGTTGGIDPTSPAGTGSGESSEGDGSSSSSSGPADSSSTGAPGGDPDYPRPSPVAEEGDCPDGTLGPITFDDLGWICIPECSDDDPPMCPPAATGDAEAACATSPFSSATPCTDDTDCDIEGERCGNIGMDQMGCLLAPTHCILRCNDGQTCPDEMECGPAGICAYPEP